MSVLSEWDIINELGRGIFIYPFKGKEDSITGCCLHLTASEYAYTFNIAQPTQEPQRLLFTDQDDKKFIKIPSRKTAITWTNESVFLGNYLCGSLHSKVKLVSQGLGHIGTRVNPNYGGILAIALHNLSDNDILIEVGETIAYLRVHRLTSPSSAKKSDDSGKLVTDAIPGDSIPSKLKAWINDPQNRWRKGEPEEIWKVLEASSGYQTAKDELKKKSIRYRLVFKYLPQWDATVWAGIIGALATLVVGIPAWLALRPSSPPSFDPKPIITPKTQIAPTPKATSVPK
ncbi:dCTP deaminase domain-containing protein [Microcoleus sp. S13_C5]|uniref:dCTP deaminase domain-containing protein n=1 Tax=Microcoleus sp. S13_C5 TaxID=3055411 RepID=UPI002FD24CC2